MHYITAVRLGSGSTHEHITDVMWLNSANGNADDCKRAAMIEFIDKGNPVQVGGPSGPVAVGVVRLQGRQPYLRTHADGTWRDNLLSLPRF